MSVEQTSTGTGSAVSGPGLPGLLERQPLGFGRDTLGDMVDSVSRSLSGDEPGLLETLAGRGISGAEALGVLAAVILTALAHAGLWRVTKRHINRSAERLTQRFQDRAAAGLTALYATLLLSAPPLLLWAGAQWLLELSGPGPSTLLLWRIARLYSVLTILLAGLKEFGERRVLRLREEERRRFHWGVLACAGFIGVARLTITLTSLVSDRPDYLAFQSTVFWAGLLLILAVLCLQRRAVLAMLPNADHPLFHRFLALIHRFYPVVYIFTVGLAMLWLLGFRALTRFLLERSWLIVIVILGLMYLERFVTRAAGRLTTAAEGQPEPTPAAISLSKSIQIVVRVFTGVGALVISLNLLGLLSPIVALLSVSLFEFRDQAFALWGLVQAIFVFVGFLLAARLLRDVLEFWLYPRIELEPGTGTAVSTTVFYVLALIGAFFALLTSGVDPTVLTVFAGAAGIGLGLGLQRFAANIASGMVLIFGRAVRKGDVVSAGDEIGIVQDIGMRATVLKNLDNIEVLIPNEVFINERIINWTLSDPLVRVHISVGVSYASDPEAVRELLLRAAAEHPLVRKRPAPDVWFMAFGDSSLDFHLLAWVDIRKISRGKVTSDLLFALFRLFKENGIEIPFPQRDLHLKSGWPRPSKK